MATFGKTAVGGTNNGVGAQHKYGNRFQLTENGTVTSVSVYLVGANLGVGQNIQFCIYDGAVNDAPGALRATCVAANYDGDPANTPAAWYTQNITGGSVSLTAGYYYLGFIGDANDVAIIAKFDTDGVAGTWAHNADTYADGPSDPFGTNAASGSTVNFSVYATYTAARAAGWADVTVTA